MNRSLHGNISQHGFGLVEIMIAITLGLLLTVAVLQLFISNNQSYQASEAISLVQDGARYLQTELTKELRMTGYRGCLSKQNVTLTNTLNNSGTLAYNFTAGLRGYNNLTSTLPAELSTLLTGDPLPRSGTDLLLIQAPFTPPFSISANSSSSQIFSDAQAGQALSAADIAMITDCNKGHIFQISAITASAATSTISHDGSSMTPGNAVTSWATTNPNNAYDTHAEIMGYQTQTYYIANNSATGRPALYLKINGQAATVMLDDVYDMQIKYGIDDNGDRQLDRYVDSPTVSIWNNVMALKLELLMASPETGIVPKVQTIRFNGSNFTAPDTRWYMATTVTAVLRNRLN